MSYLKNIEWHQSQNMGSIIQLRVARVDDIAREPDLIGDTLTGDYGFANFVGFFTWKVATQRIGIDTKSRDTEEGTRKDSRLEFVVPKDQPGIREMLTKAEADEFIVYYKDANGMNRIFGRKEFPVSFLFDKSTGKSTSNLNGYSCQFYYRGPENDFFLDGTIEIPDPPLTPTVLTVNENAADAPNTLAWTDNSDNESSFIIYRSVSGGIFEPIGEVNEGVTTYEDQEFQLGNEFSYKVVARNAGGESDFSNTVSITLLGIKILANPIAQQTISVTKTGTATKWIEPDDTETDNNELTTDQAGTIYAIVDDKSTVTAMELDDLSAVGDIDLRGGYTNLDTFSSANNNINLLVDADYIQRANISIDVTNSFAQNNAAKLTTLIDRIIIANGGTTTDDGTDYTGSAGNNFANRTLIIGTLTIDISISSNKILFQKITALEALGWTVNTIKTFCEKSLNIDTGISYYAVSMLEKSTEIVSIIRDSGSSLFIDLYDTQVNADPITNPGSTNGGSAGGTDGTTGKLNSITGVSGINDWITNNNWNDGTDYYLRIYSVDKSSVSNTSTIKYKAFPTSSRPCGSIVDVLGISAFIAYSVKKRVQKNYDQAIIILRRESDGQVNAWFPDVNGDVVFSGSPSYNVTLPSTVTYNLSGNKTYNVNSTESIETWAGGSVVKILALMDQSGNENHIFNLSPSVMPILNIGEQRMEFNNTNPSNVSDQASYLYLFAGSVPTWAIGVGNPSTSLICKMEVLASDWGSRDSDPDRQGAVLFALRQGSAGSVISSLTIERTDNSGAISNKATITQRKDGNVIRAEQSNVISVGQEMFIGGVLDQENDELKIYKDTTLLDSINNVMGNFSGSSYFFILGTALNGSNFFSARKIAISELIFYQDPLSDIQLNSIINQL